MKSMEQMVMKNSYKVIISRKVSQMLFSHIVYLAQVPPDAAKNLATEFKFIKFYVTKMQEIIFLVINIIICYL